MKFKAKNEKIIKNEQELQKCWQKIWRIKYVHEHNAYENITLDM